jgi:hypothetical protein
MFTSLKQTPDNYETSKRDATYTHPIVVHSADAAALPVVHCKCCRGWQPNFLQRKQRSARKPLVLRKGIQSQ